jgi:predicted nucleotidyltransferase
MRSRRPCRPKGRFGGMATARSLELQALARRVADRFPPEIDEVLLTGSASRGVSDEDSDFELLLVGESLPQPEEIAAGLDVFDVGEMPDRRGWWIGGTAEGEFFELIAWSRARTEERVAGILAAEIVDHVRIRTAEAIVHGLPLRTSGRLGEWQERLDSYPDALADAIVLDAIGDWTEQTPRGIRALRRPGGRLDLAKHVVDDLENVLRIVFALNRAWEPDWKRLPEIVAPLSVRPERLAERIEEALRGDDIVSARELVRDTLSLAPDLPRVAQARELTAAILAELA